MDVTTTFPANQRVRRLYWPTAALDGIPRVNEEGSMLRRHHEHFTVREFAVKLKRLSWATPLVVILALSSVAVTHGGNVDAIAERRGTV